MTASRRSRLYLAALTLSLLACGRAPSDTAAAPSPRVVSLAPALTAIVTTLGATAHLVGVTRWCTAPGVAVVGDMRPRLDAVLAAKPELVLAAGYGVQDSDLASLSSLGLEVATVPLVTLADMRAATERLGDLLHREAEARAALAQFDAAVAAAQSAAAGSKPVKTLIVYALEPGFVVTTGGGDHIAELITLAGGVNVVHGPLTARLGLEQVLALQPELILYVAPTPDVPDEAAARRAWAGWPTLPAVAHGVVLVYPDDGLARNGPALAAALPRLSAMMARARSERSR